MVANSRAQRHMRSNLTNPDYKLSETGYDFSVAENAAILAILGDKRTLTCPKKFANFIFGKESLPLRRLWRFRRADISTCVVIEKEQLPYSIGWKKSALPISTEDLIDAFQYAFSVSLFLYLSAPIPVIDLKIKLSPRFLLTRRFCNSHIENATAFPFQVPDDDSGEIFN